MLPDRVSNPGPLTYESGALPIALRGPAPTERNGLSNFCRGSPKEPSCKIISKSMPSLRRSSHLKAFSIFSYGGHLVQQSGTV